jgi:cbb3-type cytochrome oxidase cytochrome c subunit
MSEITCTCGSGLPSERQYDARGIYLQRTCKKCHRRKMMIYRPDVLTDPNYWHDEPIDEE